MIMKWKPVEAEDPYVSLIESFIGKEFPQFFCSKTENIVDAVIDEFLATKQVRIGPKPNPESIVMMRDVVRRAVQAERSIPILIASAAVKVPLGNEIDLAELSAIRILGNLQDRILHYYKHGVDVRIRMEDLTELVLTPDNPDVTDLAADYVGKFKGLVRALGYDEFIHPIKESIMGDASEFLDKVQNLVPAFKYYLEKSDKYADPKHHFGWIEKLGWKGPISLETRDFLSARYEKMYPGTTRDQHREMMADYFAAILARHQMGIIGNDKSFEGRLEISFNPPLPNHPPISTRVQYRSVPLSQSSNNRPYWLAKGYMRISNDNDARLALGDWKNEEYHEGHLVLNSGTESVSIRADYVLE